MISVEAAIQKFKDILGTQSEWRYLVKSQFVRHIAIFMGWALRDALWKIERAKQEYFLSTAMNPGSIMSHAEDREYIPRKRTPAYGQVVITNKGTAPASIFVNQSFISDQSLEYATTSAITIQPGNNATVTVEQRRKETKEFTVQERRAFYAILFDKEITEQICGLAVQVDEGMGAGFVDYEYHRLFQSAYATSRVYDEFFNHLGQTGIRFGNDDFGKILAVGMVVKVELWLTEGESYLAEGQRIHPTSEGNDHLEIVTLEAITGGTPVEGIEEMRNNLRYWITYNEKLVWRDDYIFFLRRAIPDIVWINVWGEQEEEAVTGLKKVENINNIFISAHAPGHTNLSDEIMAALKAIRLLNRAFTWRSPTYSTFNLAITGAVSPREDITTVTTAIWAVVIDKYGRDSRNRRSQMLVKDIYDDINGTGYFGATGAHFEVQTSGVTEAEALHEMVSVSEANFSITLVYL